MPAAVVGLFHDPIVSPGEVNVVPPRKTTGREEACPRGSPDLLRMLVGPGSAYRLRRITSPTIPAIGPLVALTKSPTFTDDLKFGDIIIVDIFDWLTIEPVDKSCPCVLFDNKGTIPEARVVPNQLFVTETPTGTQLILNPILS